MPHLGLFMYVNYPNEHSMADHFASPIKDTLDHSYPVILYELYCYLSLQVLFMLVK